MNNRLFQPCVRIGLFCLLAAGGVQAKPFHFIAGGDVPYTPGGLAVYRQLLEQTTTTSPAFHVHVGDIKHAKDSCGDEALKEIRDLFRAQTLPLAFTPGDNDWTDCHEPSAGGFDPLERLERLRQLFYSDPTVLKLNRLGFVAPDPHRPEHYWFVKENVLFASLHIVGNKKHCNNRNPDVPASMAEFQQREKAVLAFLGQTFAKARTENRKGLVLLFHADPRFERDKPKKCFRAFLEALQQEVARTPLPILAIHGDSHRYRLDHPLADSASNQAGHRLTRLEVPGFPDIQLVDVKVDPDAREPFEIELLDPSMMD